jgi:hypothetical protein
MEALINQVKSEASYRHTAWNRVLLSRPRSKASTSLAMIRMYNIVFMFSIEPCPPKCARYHCRAHLLRPHFCCRFASRPPNHDRFIRSRLRAVSDSFALLSAQSKDQRLKHLEEQAMEALKVAVRPVAPPRSRSPLFVDAPA